MAKRRTKKQKREAKYSYLTTKYSVGDESVTVTSTNKILSKVADPHSGTSLYIYDPALIKADLFKTVLVSTIVIGIELFLFWYFG